MMRPGKNLILKPFEPEDGDLMSAWYYSGQYPDFFREFSFVPTREQFRNFASLSSSIIFMVHGKEGVIGTVMFYDIKPVAGVAKLGIMIDRQHHNQKNSPEIFWIALQYAFEDLLIRKLVFEVVDPRLRMILAQSGYFSAEAILKREARVQGELRDVFRFTIEHKACIQFIEHLGRTLCQQHQQQPQ